MSRTGRTTKPAENTIQQLERERRHLQQRLGILTASLPVGVFEADIAGRCQFLTQTCTDILSVSFLDGFIGSWFDYLHPEDRQEVAENWRTSWRHSEPFATECRVVARDGGQRWVLIHGWPLITDFAPVYLGTIEDITEQRRIARDLQRQTDQVEWLRHSSQQKNLRLQNLVRNLQLAQMGTSGDLPQDAGSLLNLCHRIRTSLTAIQGLAEASADQADAPDSLDTALHAIRQNTGCVLELLDQALIMAEPKADL